jgi:hypothetical protein
VSGERFSQLTLSLASLGVISYLVATVSITAGLVAGMCHLTGAFSISMADE